VRLRIALFALLLPTVSCGRAPATVEVHTIPRPIVTTATTAAPTSTTAARQLRPEVPRAHTTAPMVRAASVDVSAGSSDPWSCGADLPPCWVLHRENPNRDLRAYNGGCHYPPGYAGTNPCGSTASGKWQFIRSTWAMFGGFVNAADAPWQVQDEKARQTWAHGAGCSHWSAC
jgi:hypothetical protein